MAFFSPNRELATTDHWQQQWDKQNICPRACVHPSEIVLSPNALPQLLLCTTQPYDLGGLSTLSCHLPSGQMLYYVVNNFIVHASGRPVLHEIGHVGFPSNYEVLKTHGATSFIFKKKGSTIRICTATTCVLHAMCMGEDAWDIYTTDTDRKIVGHRQRDLLEWLAPLADLVGGRISYIFGIAAVLDRMFARSKKSSFQLQKDSAKNAAAHRKEEEKREKKMANEQQKNRK